jgi:hypothetical protein
MLGVHIDRRRRTNYLVASIRAVDAAGGIPLFEGVAQTS